MAHNRMPGEAALTRRTPMAGAARVGEVRVGAMCRCSLEPELLRSSAGGVEELGYDELWIVEDCFYAGGIASAATALAATERITVGLGILPAVLRNPAATAMELAALACLHPGRVVPGLGHGVAAWMRQVGALPPSQLAALGETISAVRALLAGQTVTAHGAHVHLDEVRLDHPPRSAPPVLAGVRGPRSLRLCGRLADGTILTELSSPGYVRWARRASHRTGPSSTKKLPWTTSWLGASAGRGVTHAAVTATPTAAASDAPSVKGRSVAVGTMAERACCAAALAGLALASDGPPCLAGRMKPRRRPRA
jgi:alkanesulfonate monooxygenase SsuD/methylene tetrahydromethanopterin reductase-like flavin-dependent oxidoreductase (luciferase family)